MNQDGGEYDKSWVLFHFVVLCFCACVFKTFVGILFQWLKKYESSEKFTTCVLPESHQKCPRSEIK